MKRIIVSLISILILLASTRCYHESEVNHCFIQFANNSIYSVYIEQLESYPDTISLLEYRFWPKKSNLVEPKTISKYLRSTGYEYEFGKNNNYKSIDTLMIFVFDAEKVDADVSPQEAVIARYDVSLEDLQSNNWMLSYPPNDNMASIKMWPFYASYEKSTN